MEGRVGDRLIVKGHRVGEADHVGEIVEVLAGGKFRVRWADGRQTLMIPGTDATIERPAEKGPATEVRDLTVTVDLRIHEDRDHCRVEALMRTSSGVLRGDGEARRRPNDPEVPLIGEELAVARALADLAGTLERAARDEIAAPTDPTMHLVS